MTSVDLSLDDIIAKSRKNRTGGKPGGFKPRGQGNRNGFRGSRSNGDGNRAFRGNGGSRGDRGYVDYDAPRSQPVIGGNPSKIIRVNISNLASTVSSQDLEELFAAYPLDSACVHYNERGHSLGTADVYVPRRDADRLVKEFRGVALDNEVMSFYIADESIKNRVSVVPSSRGPYRTDFKSRTDSRASGRRSGGGGGGSGFRDGNRGKFTNRRRGGGDKFNERSQKSAEELDAELDAYMSKKA